MPNGREAGEVPVEGDNFASVLKGDGPDHCIGNQVPHGVRFVAQPSHEREMTRSGTGKEEVRLCAGGLDEREGLVARGGHREDASVCGEAKKGRPHDRRDGKGVVASQQAIEPGTDSRVLRMVVTMRHEHDVDVEEKHF